MSKKVLFLFIILIVFAIYVASILVSRAKYVDTLYGRVQETVLHHG